MNKLLLTLLLGMLLLLPVVSAVKVDYSPNEKAVENMVAHVHDTILFGLIKVGEQGTMELKSHKSPTQILRVGAGWQVTMIYDTNFGETHKDSLGDVNFIDMRTGDLVEREYKFVYWGTETRQRDTCLTYETITNSTNSSSFPKCSEYGEEDYEFEGWLDYNSKDLPKGQIKLGLMTNVLVDDYIDGIWEVQGKKIEKHASWTANLNTDLISYYKLDETSGTIAIDSVGNANATNIGTATVGATGKINTAYDFDGTNDYLNRTGHIDIGASTTAEHTFNFWLDQDVVTGVYFSQDMGTAGTQWFTRIDSGNWQTAFVFTDGTYEIAVAEPFDTGQWDMITITYTPGNLTAWRNGQIFASDTSLAGGTFAEGTGNFIIADGNRHLGGEKTNGGIDEVGIWNRALTSDEVTQLYNGGDGISYTALSGLSVVLNSPINAYNQTTLDPIGFNVTVTDDLGINNVTLYINGVLNETNSSGINGTYIFTKNFPDGNYNWSILAFDNEDNSNQSETRTFSIDTEPTINVFSPIDNENYSTSTIYFNATSDLTVDEWKVDYNGTNQTLSAINTTLTVLDGDYNLNFWGRNAESGVWGLNDSISFSVDTTLPTIDFLSPNETYNYLNNESTLYLSGFVNDTNLDTCWYEYKGANNTFSCTTETLFNETITQGTSSQTSITVYANDTFGNEFSDTVTWDYKVYENSREYELETIEGNYEEFTLNLVKSGSNQVSSAVLNYNGGSYSSDLFVSGSNISIVSEFLISGVSADTNNTFYWTVTLLDGTTLNTTSSVQLVRDVSFDDCSAEPYEIINLFLKDEETRDALNGTIEIDFQILNSFNYEQVIDFTSEYPGVTEKSFCSNINFTATSFLLDAEIRYSSENHSTEFYHIQRAELSDYPQNLSLFDLATEDTTKFKILYRGEQLLGIEGAILQLQRKYFEEGVYEVVEAPLTSSDSTGILHIDINTNKYQITVVKNGEVLGMFQNLAFICQSELTGECTLDLFDSLNPPNINSLSTIQDFSYLVTTSLDNETITLEFTIPSGTPSSINLVAIQQDTILGESTICNQTIITSAGSIECGYTPTIQDSIITLRVYKDSELYVQRTYAVQEDLRSDWGGTNYILLIILLLSLVFMAISSPEWVVVNAVVTILLGGGVWLIRGIGLVEGLGSIMWLIIAAIIIISKSAEQEDR